MNQCPICGKNIPSHTRTCPECGETLPLWNRILDRFGGTIPDLFQKIRKIFGDKESTILDIIAFIFVLIYVMAVVYIAALPFTFVKMLLSGYFDLTYLLAENIYMMFVLYFGVGIFSYIDTIIRRNRNR